jgi:Post-segregation antitoxin CcdA
MSFKGKRKLTLTVDADTVDRARKQDINISDLTERILQTVTVEDGSLSPAEERKEYLRLLSAMDPVINAHHVKVPVGKGYHRISDWADDEETELFYVGGGQFEPRDPNALRLDLSGDHSNDWSWSLEEIEDKDTYIRFESPMRIIGNFVEKVGESKRRREVEMHDLHVARSVLEAVLGAERPSSSPSGASDAIATSLRNPGSKAKRSRKR